MSKARSAVSSAGEDRANQGFEIFGLRGFGQNHLTKQCVAVCTKPKRDRWQIQVVNLQARREIRFSPSAPQGEQHAANHVESQGKRLQRLSTKPLQQLFCCT